ncbi:MAG: TraB/GumN family protein [Clostridia bacterium]|nr:TraB/GumN family protein [Clostridia bacterium]
MKNVKRILAVLLTVVICLSATGCDAIMDIVQQSLSQYEDNSVDLDSLDPGSYEGDFYDLEVFDDLPTKESKATPMFWKCENEDGNVIYFLGSIHVADDSAYRFNETIMDAFIEADALAVECDTIAFESDYMAQLQMSSSMMYMDGDKVQNHMSPELYEGLVEILEEYPDSWQSLGYTMEMLDMCKPAMWSSLMDNIVLAETDLESEKGIDMHFLKLAKEMNKSIIEVESVEFQMDMLANFSDELYELLLEGYLEVDIKEQAEGTEELYKLWKKGDVDEFTENVATLPDVDYTLEENGGYTEEESDLINDYNDQMLFDRNIGMADAAEEYLASGKTVFYVVGAAHFVGEGGIIELMEERGYEVEFIGGKNLK